MGVIRIHNPCSVAWNVVQSLIHVQIYSTAFCNRWHFLCHTICLRHRVLPKHVSIHLNDFHEKRSSRESRVLHSKSWIKGFRGFNTTTMFPTGFFLFIYFFQTISASFYILTINPLKSLCEVSQERVRERLLRMRPCSSHHARWSISRHSRELLAIIWGFLTAVKCEVSDREVRWNCGETNITALHFAKHRRDTAATNSRGDAEKRKSQFNQGYSLSFVFKRSRA